MQNMNNGLCTSFVVLALALPACVLDEKKIPIDRIPEPVMKAVKARLPGAEIRSAEKEVEDAVTVYDLELTCKGRKYEMDVKADGTITEIEKEIAAKDLPPVVLNVLEAKYPHATFREIMEVNKIDKEIETPYQYEIDLVTQGSKKLEVTVSIDGKKIKEAKAEDE
jgi:hypothetical protein